MGFGKCWASVQSPTGPRYQWFTVFRGHGPGRFDHYWGAWCPATKTWPGTIFDPALVLEVASFLACLPPTGICQALCPRGHGCRHIYPRPGCAMVRRGSTAFSCIASRSGPSAATWPRRGTRCSTGSPAPTMLSTTELPVFGAQARLWDSARSRLCNTK